MRRPLIFPVLVTDTWPFILPFLFFSENRVLRGDIRHMPASSVSNVTRRI